MPGAPVPVSQVYSTEARTRIWQMNDLKRGTAIEDTLAKTEYRGWYRVGQLDHGKFPLVDFWKESKVVSRLVSLERSETSE